MSDATPRNVHSPTQHSQKHNQKENGNCQEP